MDAQARKDLRAGRASVGMDEETARITKAVHICCATMWTCVLFVFALYAIFHEDRTHKGAPTLKGIIQPGSPFSASLSRAVHHGHRVHTQLTPAAAAAAAAKASNRMHHKLHNTSATVQKLTAAQKTALYEWTKCREFYFLYLATLVNVARVQKPSKKLAVFATRSQELFDTLNKFSPGHMARNVSQLSAALQRLHHHCHAFHVKHCNTNHPIAQHALFGCFPEKVALPGKEGTNSTQHKVEAKPHTANHKEEKKSQSQAKKEQQKKTPQKSQAQHKQVQPKKTAPPKPQPKKTAPPKPQPKKHEQKKTTKKGKTTTKKKEQKAVAQKKAKSDKAKQSEKPHQVPHKAKPAAAPSKPAKKKPTFHAVAAPPDSPPPKPKRAPAKHKASPQPQPQPKPKAKAKAKPQSAKAAPPKPHPKPQPKPKAKANSQPQPSKQAAPAHAPAAKAQPKQPPASKAKASVAHAVKRAAATIKKAVQHAQGQAKQAASKVKNMFGVPKGKAKPPAKAPAKATQSSAAAAASTATVTPPGGEEEEVPAAAANAKPAGNPADMFEHALSALDHDVGDEDADEQENAQAPAAKAAAKPAPVQKGKHSRHLPGDIPAVAPIPGTVVQHPQKAQVQQPSNDEYDQEEEEPADGPTANESDDEIAEDAANALG